MRPKKKPKEPIQTSKVLSDDALNDHETFLQAFEKPTQIYRYLRSRHQVSPIYLNRNLTYMRNRMSRNNKARDEMSVDDVLKKVMDKKTNPDKSLKSKMLTLQFKGFYLKDDHFKADCVEIEAFILKVHKKRKQGDSPLTKTSLGRVEVDYNPVTPGNSVIMVNNENFTQTNGSTGKSYILQLIVKPINRKPMNGYSDHKTEEPPQKKNRGGQKKDLESIFCAELVIYDKSKRCMLKDGDYDVMVTPIVGCPSPKSPTPLLTSPTQNHSNWESLKDDNINGPFEMFQASPMVKFQLTWSGDTDPDTDSDHNSAIEKAAQSFKKKLDHCIKHQNSSRTRVFYQFIYNNSTRQQTEARSDFTCPWCVVNCLELYSLIKHLRLTHSRFHFIYSPHPNGARIDVSINESYDGSYDGNPQDILSNIGCAFCRVGPIRRTPVTCLLVYRPKRGPSSLSEFMEVDEPESLRNRSLQDGHNRLYYHTESNQPVHPREIIIDSEGENDPQWLQQKTVTLIDDFTDVNEGEKEIMKMWNLHIMHDNYIGDCQLSIACASFIEKYGKTVLEKNLTKNLLLHLVSLYDFSLIRPDVVYRTMNMLQALRERLEDEGTLFLDATGDVKMEVSA